MFQDYKSHCASADWFEAEDLMPVVYGLFGEVGSVLSTIKKYHREEQIFVGFHDSLVEELGDVLWYLAAVSRRLSFDLEEMIGPTRLIECENSIELGLKSPAKIAQQRLKEPKIVELIVQLGQDAAGLLSLPILSRRNQQERLIQFTLRYWHLVQVLEISINQIIEVNREKTKGRFVKIEIDELPNFDSTYPTDEQIPNVICAKFVTPDEGDCEVVINGKPTNGTLRDNIKEPDGYRFHDVFHIAYASVLHWSPVFRNLTGCKRKSDPIADENEDGGRARVIEEGLAAYIFSYAKDHNFFDNHEILSFDLLKVIEKFITGFEVQHCPLSLWERAILQGFKAFRQVKDNGGGIVNGNRYERTVKFVKSSS